MMSHQTSDAIASTDPTQKAGTVERVKSSVDHSRSIPDIVQPGCRYQGTIGQPKSLSNLLCPVSNTLDMPPPSRQVGQIPLGENARISGRYHGFEPMGTNLMVPGLPSLCVGPAMPGPGCLAPQIRDTP